MCTLLYVITFSPVLRERLARAGIAASTEAFLMMPPWQGLRVKASFITCSAELESASVPALQVVVPGDLADQKAAIARRNTKQVSSSAMDKKKADGKEGKKRSLAETAPAAPEAECSGQLEAAYPFTRGALLDGDTGHCRRPFLRFAHQLPIRTPVDLRTDSARHRGRDR